jgi:hypothetical protein
MPRVEKKHGEADVIGLNDLEEPSVSKGILDRIQKAFRKFLTDANVLKTS